MRNFIFKIYKGNIVKSGISFIVNIFSYILYNFVDYIDRITGYVVLTPKDCLELQTSRLHTIGYYVLFLAFIHHATFTTTIQGTERILVKGRMSRVHIRHHPPVLPSNE